MVTLRIFLKKVRIFLLKMSYFSIKHLLSIAISLLLLIDSPMLFIFLLPVIMLFLYYVIRITRIEALIYFFIIFSFWFFAFIYYSHLLILDCQLNPNTWYTLNRCNLASFLQLTVDTPSIFRPLFVETVVIYEILFTSIGLTAHLYFYY